MKQSSNTGARLVYIAGPSGAGKDTLLNFVREALAGYPILFAHRYITRKGGEGNEAHVPLTPTEFQARLDRGLFALHWQSHGLRYGIGIEIDQWLQAGCSVVINGSRGAFEAALTRYPRLTPILITAAPETLRRRLLARGREDTGDIDGRLTRDVDFDHPRLTAINNDGSIVEAGEALLHALQEGLA